MENMEKFMEKVVESISHGRAQKSSNPVIVFSGFPAFCWTPYDSTFDCCDVLNGKVDVLTMQRLSFYHYYYYYYYFRDTDGRTPLHFAAAKGSLKSVQLICAASSNCINVEDNADQVIIRKCWKILFSMRTTDASKFRNINHTNLASIPSGYEDKLW